MDQIEKNKIEIKNNINNNINYLNKKYPKQLIQVRDQNILDSLINQFSYYELNKQELGIKIALRHPLVNGNKRLGFMIYTGSKDTKFLNFFDDFDKG